MMPRAASIFDIAITRAIVRAARRAAFHAYDDIDTPLRARAAFAAAHLIILFSVLLIDAAARLRRFHAFLQHRFHSFREIRQRRDRC